MSGDIEITLADADATTALGARIAPRLRIGDAVLLYGPLGMGKSTLARGLIRALTRPDEDVPSPTFTLVQFYEPRNPGIGPPIAHFDLYRLTRPEEAFEIGLDDALEDGSVLIEWPERLGEDVSWIAGTNLLCITLSEQGGGRLATVSGAGSWVERLQELHV